MISLGDGPYYKEAADQQVTELLEACIIDHDITTKTIEVIDPESETVRVMNAGIYIPAMAKQAKKIDVEVFKVVGRLCGISFILLRCS